MQFGSREFYPIEIRNLLQRLRRFGSDNLRSLLASMLNVVVDKWFFVLLLLRSITKFFVFCKDLSVSLMKGLLAKRLQVCSEVDVGKKQHMKCSLAKFEVGDRFIPTGFRTSIEAHPQHA